MCLEAIELMASKRAVRPYRVSLFSGSNALVNVKTAVNPGQNNTERGLDHQRDL